MTGMAGYLLRRALLSLLTMVVITLAVYAAIRFIPGGPTWGEDPESRPMVEAWQAGTLSGPEPERFRFYDRTLQARRMLRFLESVVGAERPAVDGGAVDRRLAPGARRGEC